MLFREDIQAKGSSVARSPYNIIVGRFIVSIYDLGGIFTSGHISINRSIIIKVHHTIRH